MIEFIYDESQSLMLDIKNIGNADIEGIDVEHLYVAYRADLIRYLRNYLSSADDAEEIAQEAYTKLCKCKGYENSKSFLFCVARNLAIDLLRRQKKSPVDFSERPEGYSTQKLVEYSAEEENIAIQLDEKVSFLLAELPPKIRKAFMLYKYERQEYACIAQLMCVSESSVRKYVTFALQYLTDSFNE